MEKKNVSMVQSSNSLAEPLVRKAEELDPLFWLAFCGGGATGMVLAGERGSHFCGAFIGAFVSTGLLELLYPQERRLGR